MNEEDASSKELNILDSGESLAPDPIHGQIDEAQQNISETIPAQDIPLIIKTLSLRIALLEGQLAHYRSDRRKKVFDELFSYVKLERDRLENAARYKEYQRMLEIIISLL